MKTLSLQAGGEPAALPWCEAGPPNQVDSDQYVVNDGLSLDLQAGGEGVDRVEPAALESRPALLALRRPRCTPPPHSLYSGYVSYERGTSAQGYLAQEETAPP